MTASVRRLTAAQQAAHQLALDIPTPRHPAMAEAELLEAVRRLAQMTGWLLFHCHDSRKSIGPGYPDCTLVSTRRPRVIFAELKTDTGRTTPAQDAWLGSLARAGAEVALWRPRDLPDIAAVLQGRPCDPWPAAHRLDDEGAPRGRD